LKGRKFWKAGVGVGNFGKVGVGVRVGYFTSNSATLFSTRTHDYVFGCSYDRKDLAVDPVALGYVTTMWKSSKYWLI